MSQKLVELKALSKTFGSRLILDEINLTISKGDHFALVGENGAGKTTLAKILLGLEAADSGKREIAPGISMGYLSQTDDISSQEKSIHEFLLDAQGNLDAIKKRMTFLEEEMAKPMPQDPLQKIMIEWDFLHEKWQAKEGWKSDALFQEVLKAFSLDSLDLSNPLSELSSGQRQRVFLASLLLSSQDLLILDEPTNHLDFKALLWLEEYLKNCNSALMLISHDRKFINAVCNHIIELSKQSHSLTVYGGSYDDFLVEKKREEERKLKAYEAQKEEIKELKSSLKAKTFSKPNAKPPSDNDTMQQGFFVERGQRSERKIIDQTKARLESLLENPLENPVPRTVKGIYFQPKPLGSDVAITCESLCKSYNNTPFLQNISFCLKSNSKIVVTGENGCGKSTLFKIICGLQNFDAGSLKISPQVIVGYLDQNFDTLDETLTPLDALTKKFNLQESEARSELHKSKLLHESIIHTKIAELSAGQKRKLQILFLILSHANVLLLDEPTNHLDLATLEELEQGLASFQGAVFAISHDRYFIEKIAQEVWHLKNGVFIPKPDF
jgi:ATP-binding cassette, subfamily F, member 3